MRVKHYANGKFYTIDCPEGTRVVRRSEQPADGGAVLHDHLLVPLNAKHVRIPADPPDLLPLLAESGNFVVTLVGEPEPDERLAGASCPGCGENDVNWLQVQDSSETVHCDYCGADFALPVPTVAQVSTSHRAGR
jgi:Zn ribbon nucleic-acid-binding protein